MPIDDVHVITGRGTLVTGRIEQGAVKENDPVTITGAGAKPTFSVVTRLALMSGKAVDQAKAGDSVSLLLRGVRPEDAGRGRVLQGS
ncbi:EF-Tu/IF-2/RF-3 family GTPase [Geodermatophilus sp. CPCC 205506]|uniref:EF-Tu/IF-2/RF-3 family GTPase n=1 Tax=Geodermatophilus sp. CPCC 205506 TaxID=2936596 RepID=UPI003EEAD71E